MKILPANASDFLQADVHVAARGQRGVLTVRDPLHAAVYVHDVKGMSPISSGRTMEWLIYLDRSSLDEPWRLSTEGEGQAVFGAQMGDYRQVEAADYPTWLDAVSMKAITELDASEDLVATTGIERVRQRIQEMSEGLKKPEPNFESRARREATGAKSSPSNVPPVMSKVFKTEVGPVLAVLREGPKLFISSIPDYPLIGIDRMAPNLPQLAAVWQGQWLARPSNPVTAALADRVLEMILADHKPELEQARMAIEINEARILKDMKEAHDAFLDTIRARIAADEGLIETVEARRAPALVV